MVFARVEAERSTLRQRMAVFQRRKRLVLVVVVLVTLAAVLGSLLQDKRFQASSEVLLTQENLAADLTGVQASSVFRDPERLAQTRARLARGEDLATLVLRGARRSDRTPAQFLRSSSVAPNADSDILVFRVTDRYRDVATRLATEYGRQFTRYISQLDTAPLLRAQRTVQGRLRELEAAGRRDSRVYAALTQNLDELRVLQALRTSNATLVRPAELAQRVQPRPLRSGVLGLIMGLALAIGLAFLREALDTRVRTGGEVAERLRMPLLARLPAPPRHFRPRQDLVMLREPTSPSAEPFRVLRTNLEFVSLESRSSVVMITSASQAEGKSTTVANLAVALARSGRRVILVDLDLRRPTLDRFFGAQGRPGLTEVALGHIDLDDALLDVPLDEDEPAPSGSGDGDIRRLSLSDGRLEMLPTGPLPPDAGGFIGSAAMTEVLAALRGRADIVLIDTPPVLPVGDAMTLSAKVDGIVVISRLNVATRPSLAELRRQLDASPAAKLGVVLGQAEVEGAAYAGGRYSYYYQPDEPDSEPELVVEAEPELPPPAAPPQSAPRRRQASPYPTAAEVRQAAAQRGATLDLNPDRGAERVRNGKHAGVDWRSLARLIGRVRRP